MQPYSVSNPDGQIVTAETFGALLVCPEPSLSPSEYVLSPPPTMCIDCKWPQILCRSSHEEVKSASLPLQSELALCLALTNRKWQEWRYVGSKTRPQRSSIYSCHLGILLSRNDNLLERADTPCLMAFYKNLGAVTSYCGLISRRWLLSQGWYFLTPSVLGYGHTGSHQWSVSGNDVWHLLAEALEVDGASSLSFPSIDCKQRTPRSNRTVKPQGPMNVGSWSPCAELANNKDGQHWNVPWVINKLLMCCDSVGIRLVWQVTNTRTHNNKFFCWALL